MEPEPEGCPLEHVTRVGPALSHEEETIARVCEGEQSCFHDLLRPYAPMDSQHLSYLVVAEGLGVSV